MTMETGWLLEKTNLDGGALALYLGTDTNSEFCWTVENLRALRFARKEDAERFSASGKKAGYSLVILREPHEIVEYGWNENE